MIIEESDRESRGSNFEEQGYGKVLFLGLGFYLLLAKGKSESEEGLGLMGTLGLRINRDLNILLYFLMTL